MDNNFESSILFALFPDFPTSPVVPIIYGFTHKLKGTSSTTTPFYPARGIVDTLGCTWNTTSVFTKVNCVALKILHSQIIPWWNAEYRIWPNRIKFEEKKERKKKDIQNFQFELNKISIKIAQSIFLARKFQHQFRVIPSNRYLKAPIKGENFKFLQAIRFGRKFIQLGQFRLYVISFLFWDITISPTPKRLSFRGRMISYEILDEKLAKLRILRWPCRENCTEADKNQRPTNARFVTSVFSLHTFRITEDTMRESTWKISTMIRLATNPDEIYGESVFFRLYVYLDLIGGVFSFDEKNKIIRMGWNIGYWRGKILFRLRRLINFLKNVVINFEFY